MKTGKIAVILCAAMVSACTSIRVSGMVTDQRTGDPVGVCGVMIGSRYVRTDPIGKYVIGADASAKSMQFIAPGYETRTVPIDSSKTRYPVIDVQMVPKSNKPKVDRGSEQ